MNVAIFASSLSVAFGDTVSRQSTIPDYKTILSRIEYMILGCLVLFIPIIILDSASTHNMGWWPTYIPVYDGAIYAYHHLSFFALIGVYGGPILFSLLIHRLCVGNGRMAIRIALIGYLSAFVTHVVVYYVSLFTVIGLFLLWMLYPIAMVYGTRKGLKYAIRRISPEPPCG